ncbi:MAG: hypothetical protein ACREE0_04540 [Phenylobacterium sp.]
MESRFVTRPDSDGYSVRDLWTGQPAILAAMPQKGLSQEDAEHTAALLNRSAADPAQPN